MHLLWPTVLFCETFSAQPVMNKINIQSSFINKNLSQTLFSNHFHPGQRWSHPSPQSSWRRPYWGSSVSPRQGLPDVTTWSITVVMTHNLQDGKFIPVLWDSKILLDKVFQMHKVDQGMRRQILFFWQHLTGRSNWCPWWWGEHICPCSSLRQLQGQLNNQRENQ